VEIQGESLATLYHRLGINSSNARDGPDAAFPSSRHGSRTTTRGFCFWVFVPAGVIPVVWVLGRALPLPVLVGGTFIRSGIVAANVWSRYKTWLKRFQVNGDRPSRTRSRVNCTFRPDVGFGEGRGSPAGGDPLQRGDRGSRVGDRVAKSVWEHAAGFEVVVF